MMPLLSQTVRCLRWGFTLVEMLLALSLLGLLTGMLFTSFYSVTRSWEAGRSTIDAAGHADYLMDQLAAALRSAYTPGSGEKHGLVFTDDGEDVDARDTIEWSKVGPTLIGEDAEFSGVPHRVRVYVSDPEDDLPGGFTVRAWRQDLQTDEFDPELDTATLLLSPKVIGFNCRMLDPDKPRTANDEINWTDDWAKTNTLPTAVELTLWMEPPEPGGEPIESKRIVEIPIGTLSQNPNLGASANEQAKKGTSTPVGGGHRPNRRPGGGNRPPEGGNGLFVPGAGGSDGMRPPPPNNHNNLRPGGGRRPSNGGNGLFVPGKR